MNKFLLLDLKEEGGAPSKEDIQRMFRNASRIESIGFYDSLALDQSQECGRYGLLSFQSYSSAKKTLETLRGDFAKVYWVNVNRLVVAEAKHQDSHFFSFYHGDALWPWVALLPDGEEDPPLGEAAGKWSQGGRPFQMQLNIRRQENEWKLQSFDK